MTLQPATPEALKLLIDGAVAMARLESTGLRVDERYLDNAIKTTRSRIAGLERQMESSKEYMLWAKHYGDRMKLNSRSQLGHVIFALLGHKRNPFLGMSNDIAAFEHLKDPFMRVYQEVQRLKKALRTNLIAIKKETVNGRLHPFYSLAGGAASGEGRGGAESYRSSSSSPNLHNQPVRHPDIAEIVRTCFIPDPGCTFVEADGKTQEVRASCCYHKDPKLMAYVTGGGDMHRDLCLKLYMLTEQEWGGSSAIRYCAKNMFVFAQFYGSYYGLCAPALWNAISLFDLKTAQGLSLYDHLKAKGISRLGLCDPEQEPKRGTFEYHVKQVENWMWKDTFTAYDQWRRDWWALYRRQGGVNTLTGFRMEGVFRRNQVLCSSIQGDAFNWLLLKIILAQKEMIKRKMKAKVCLQIHDSTLGAVPHKELDDYVSLVNHAFTVELPRRLPWVCLPLEMEFKAGDENWFKMKKLEVKS